MLYASVYIWCKTSLVHIRLWHLDLSVEQLGFRKLASWGVTGISTKVLLPSGGSAVFMNQRLESMTWAFNFAT